MNTTLTPNVQAALETRSYRKNLALLSVVELGWGLGCAFVSFNAVMPVLATSMGASLTVVGLLPGLTSLAMSLPQMLAAHRTARLDRQLGFVTRWHVLPSLAFLALAAVVASGVRGPVGVALLYGCLTMYSLSLGYVIPVWLGFVGKLAGAARTANAFGVLSTVNLAGGAVGAGLASWFLAALPAPASYAAAALVCFGCVNVSNLAWFGVDEDAPRRSAPADGERRAASSDPQVPEGLVAYIRKQLRQAADDVAFVQFLLAQQLLLCHQVLGTFYLIWAKGRFGASQSDLLVWSGVTMVAQAAGSVFYGLLGDRLGSRLVVLGSQMLVAAAMGRAFTADSANDMLTVSALLGLFYGTYFNAKTSLILSMAAGRDAAAYLALSNTFTTPLSVLLPVVAGWAMDRWGFPPVLLAALGGTALGTLLFVLSFATADLPRSVFARLVRQLQEAMARVGGGVRRAWAALGLLF